MLATPHRAALLAGFALCACASSEAVDDTEPQEDAATEGSIGSGGTVGSGGLSGGGFPTKLDGGGGVSVEGGGSGGGGGCSAEVCNGLDDDCDGKPDNGVCTAACTGHTYSGRGYMFCSTAKSLSDAAAECVNQDMGVALPNDQAENDWLRTTATAQNMAALWLGGTDWTTEGDWKWPDGTQFWTGGASGSSVGGLYTNWAPSQPTGSKSKDCLKMDTSGKWSEVDCNELAAYVCEKY